MRIYGKTLGEIFLELPWAFRIVVVASAAFLVYIIIFFLFIAKPISLLNTEKAGDPLFPGGRVAAHVLDPSLASGGDVSGLAYSAASTGRSEEVMGGISIGVAKTTGSCTYWPEGTKVFEARRDELFLEDGESILAGLWRYETPALVFDVGDRGREWKVFAYKYYWTGDVGLAKRYSAIVMKSSPDLSPDSWSEEAWILSAAPGYPPAPYQQMVRGHVSRMSPALAGFTSYTRPSVIAVGNSLVMSLGAMGPKDETPRKIVLLASKDHGKTWGYLGTPLDVSDAAKAGPYDRIAGATLFVGKNKIWLAAVFGNKDRLGDGTFLYGFSDIGKGELLRDKNGAPVLLNKIPTQSVAPTSTGGGFAAYTDKCGHGVLTSENSGVTGKFQIFKTYLKPDEKPE